MDDFEARYYSSQYGRFATPDWSEDPEPVPYADLTDPQSLNLYDYVRNNPLSHADIDGHCCDWNDVVETVGGAMNAINQNNGVDLGNYSMPENSLGRAIGNTISLFQGAAEMVGGSGMVAGGTSEALLTSPAAATGIGALVPAAGVGTAVVGATIAVHGTAVAANAIVAFKTGPKAADAVGVTAGGQATDQYGHKVGPSGKTQVNQVDHATAKGAKDAARAEGKSAPVKHASPKKGSPHYHATDEQGNKLPCSTHHNC